MNKTEGPDNICDIKSGQPGHAKSCNRKGEGAEETEDRVGGEGVLEYRNVTPEPALVALRLRRIFWRIPTSTIYTN